VEPHKADRVQSVLYDLGCLGLEEVDAPDGTVLKAYFEATIPLPFFKEDLSKRLSDAVVREAATIGLTDASFRPAAFEPFPLVSLVNVVPPPELVDGDNLARSPYDIYLMPGLAFGTGRHETTRLVARALWHVKPYPASVLDIGTGSGVLAILARKMGIANIDAVEISEEALENARGNFERNGCADIGLRRSTAEVSGAYEVILGNILTPTILHLKSEMLRLLAPRGKIILSGITLDEADDVEDAFRDFRRLQRNDTEDWTCLTLQSPD
jgi:ribosomal protein L11 methyltransferase